MAPLPPGPEGRAYEPGLDGAATLQRFGGAAALVLALVIVLQAAFWMFYLPRLGLEERPGDPANDVQMMLAARPGLIALAVLLALGGAFAIVLVRALDERLRAGSPLLVSTASIYGYLGWGLLALASVATLTIVRNVGSENLPRQLAVQAMPALDQLQGTLFNGAIALVDVWVVLVCVATFRAGGLPRWLAGLGIVAGAFDLVNNLAELIDAPPVLLLVWFVAVGVYLLRAPRGEPAA